MATITLGVPVYNDREFLAMSIQNALDMGYENVVYLDDGSTDGSYGMLKKMTKPYKHMHVKRTRKNSVNNIKENRWYKLAKYCREFDTDWIMVRAADEIFSYGAGDLIREKLDDFHKDYVNIVKFPRADLWRSEYWFRYDKIERYTYLMQVNDSCWNNRLNWDFRGDWRITGFHKGAHKPNWWGVGSRVERLFNPIGSDPYDVVILHYGMSSHDRIADKLDYQMKTVDLIKGGTNIMPTDQMPSVYDWWHINGYRIAYEFTTALKPVSQKWYKDPLPEPLPVPEFKSLYKVIAKYNKPRAKEYKELFGRAFKK